MTEEIDRYLRAYAKRISYEHGEDAYHSVIQTAILKGKEGMFENIALCCTAIKRAVWAIFRYQVTDGRISGEWLRDEPPPIQYGSKIKEGRVLTHCRKRGHPLTEGNITYNGKWRTCLACKLITKEENREKYNKNRKESRKVKKIK